MSERGGERVMGWVNPIVAEPMQYQLKSILHNDNRRGEAFARIWRNGSPPKLASASPLLHCCMHWDRCNCIDPNIIGHVYL
jgi:hypothetical protein